WIYAAGVCNHLHSAIGNCREDAFHRANEVARISHAWVTLLLLLHDGHRDFGEVVEHQVIDVATFNLSAGRFQPVAPETLATCHARRAACVRCHCFATVEYRSVMLRGYLRHGRQDKRAEMRTG